MIDETKWTKGPWQVFTPEDYSGPNELPGLGVEAESGEAVVWYCDEPETGLGNDADAHLIAAAPELYECLKHVESLFSAHERGEELPDDDDAEKWARKTRAALAKARGES